MKIFAIYFRVEPVEKPLWFDDFRHKYDDSYDPHITLIQPRYLEDSKIDIVKEKISEFLLQQKLTDAEKTVVFTKYKRDKESEDDCTYMLCGDINTTFLTFQSNLRSTLSEFENYIEDSYKKYEENFDPHITIARNIDRDKSKKVELYLQSKFSFKGKISEIVLAVVRDTSIEEAKNPDNLTVFSI